MSKILNAQKGLKMEKKNKFTFIYNATQNQGHQESSLETPLFKMTPHTNASERTSPIPQASMTVDTLSDVREASRISKYLKNIFQTLLVILGLSLVTLNLKTFEWAKLNHNSVLILSEKFNGLGVQFEELQNTVNSLRSQLSLEVIGIEKLRKEHSDTRIEQGASISKISQTLDETVSDLNALNLKLDRVQEEVNTVNLNNNIVHFNIDSLSQKIQSLRNEQNIVNTQLNELTEKTLINKKHLAE